MYHVNPRILTLASVGTCLLCVMYPAYRIRDLGTYGGVKCVEPLNWDSLLPLSVILGIHWMNRGTVTQDPQPCFIAPPPPYSIPVANELKK